MLNNSSLTRGYSVIELLVAMTLFITVTAIAAGSTISTMRSNKDIRQNQQLTNSLDIMLEDIVRNLRVGYDYSYGSNVLKFKNDIDSRNQGKEFCIAYVGSNDVLKIWRAGGSCNNNPNSNGWSTLSPSNVVINNFKVDVYGVDAGDTVQPYVRLFIDAASKENPDKKYAYQTIVTQRKYDN